MGYVIGYFTNHTMLISLIVGAVIMTVWWLKFQKKLNMKWYVAPLLSIAHFICGAIALKIWASLEVLLGFDKTATMKLFGALFILPVLYYIGARITKRDTALVMDIAAVCCMIGFIGRVTCLVSGCCGGTLAFAGKIIRIPLNEIEMLFCVAFVLFFWQRIYRRKNAGMAFSIMMISYGVLRFVLEWFRDEYTTVAFLHLAHIWSILSIVIGCISLYLAHKHGATGNNCRNKPHSKCKNT